MIQKNKIQSLSIGKLHGLNLCSNSGGTFDILALDHRGVLEKSLGNVTDPGATFTHIVDFKMEVIAELSSSSTAILLDPGYGVGPSLGTNSFPSHCGLLITLEESGYAGEKHNRVSRLPKHWGVDDIKRIGANAVKLLIYYHPDSTQADPMKEFLKDVSASCRKHDIVLFLEVLTYSIDPNQPSLTTAEKRPIVIETARELTSMGGDVYKAEFPVNANDTSDQSEWKEACLELNEATKIPWVLLSAGVNYDTFVRQTEVACQSGASGILAGRAIWKEAVELSGSARTKFLKEVALPRMQSLDDICRTEATPWTDWYETPPVQKSWYEEYNDQSGS